MKPKDFPLNDSQLDELRAKVIQEKTEWIDHVENKRSEIEERMHKLLMKPEAWKVKVHKVWKNLNLRKAIFLRDEVDVTLVQDNGALWMKLADYAKKVIKFDVEDMDFRADKEQIITDDWMAGLGAVMIDWYDEVEQQPIRTVVNPLLCYGDPRAWNTSNMRYFGTEIEKQTGDLTEWGWYYNLDKIKDEWTCSSQEIEDFQRSRNSANRTRYIISKKGLVHVINHITTYNGKLYLSTWDAACNVNIRCIELRELTNKEKRRTDKVNLGVTIYRAKPIPYSFFGASLFDEVEQYQDLDTLMVNMQIQQALRVGRWPNKYIDSRLGMDIDAIINKPLAGATIEYAPDMNSQVDARNGITIEPTENVSQFPTQVRQLIDWLADETLGYNGQLPMGNSVGGSQTKAEIQTLQQNINEQLGMIADNYLNSDKNYFMSHIRCYASNMPDTAKKAVVLFEADKQDSYSLKKSEFIPNGKIQIYVTSKVQEDIRDKQDFAILSTVIQTLLPNLEQGSTKFYETLRLYVDKAGVKNLKGISLFPLSKTERKAQAVIEAINLEEYDKELFWPEEWDKFEDIIALIEQAIDNKYKDKALLDYQIMRDRFEEVTPEAPQVAGQANAQSNAMTANMLASQTNSNPSLSNIAA